VELWLVVTIGGIRGSTVNNNNRAPTETESTTEDESSTGSTNEASEEPSPQNNVLAELEDMTALEICEWSAVKEAAEKDVDVFYSDKYSHVVDALAESQNNNGKLYGQFKNNLGDADIDIDYNTALSVVSERADELEAKAKEEKKEEERGPTEVEEPDEPVTWDMVEECVKRNFGQKMLDNIEVLCANATILVFENVENSPMLFIEGSSGAGKSLVIKAIEDLMNELLVRVDDVTPQSFVSHGGIEDDEEQGANDILPLIKHRVMSIREMGPLFSGNKDEIEEFWSVLAGVGDGDGRVKATGNQGLRGYTGDNMFALQGATTYLKRHAWNAMGTVGGRVLFHEYDRNPSRRDLVNNQYEYDKSEAERFAEVQEVVGDFLRTVWHDIADGYGSIDWRSTEWRDGDERRSDNRDTESVTAILAELIAYARTPASRGETEEWKVGNPEVSDRLVDQLSNINAASALMKGREKVTMDDVAVSARIALSTCPKGRRPYVKWVMDHEHEEDTIELSEMVEYTGHPEGRCKSHMKLIDNLGLGEFYNDGERNSPVWKLKRDTSYTNVWETGVEFPDRMYEELH